LFDYKFKSSSSYPEKNGIYQIQQYVIKLRKIPAILVTRTPIVKLSLEPDFKSILTLDKVSFIYLLANWLQELVTRALKHLLEPLTLLKLRGKSDFNNTPCLNIL